MSQQIINIGSSGNDGTGDSIRVGGDKINDNFTELFGMIGDSVPSTTGDIDIGVDPNILTVADATGLRAYQVIAIAGAGAGGSEWVTWIESIDGDEITLHDAAASTVTDAAVTVLSGDTPTIVAEKLADATTEEIDGFTVNATKLGSFITVDEDNKALFATHPDGDFGFVIGQPEFNDFGTGQIDNTLVIYSSNQPQGGVYPSAAHPRYGEFLENFYDTGSVNVVENYVQYTSIDRGTSFRPWLLTVDVDTHHAAIEQAYKTWKLRSRTAGSGGLPDDQVIFDTSNNTNTIFGPVDIDASLLSARNRTLLKVQGNQGTGNFVELVGTGAMSNGQAFLYLNPYSTPSVDHGFVVKTYWSIPRQLTVLQNYHATGSVEAFKIALAADVFESIEVTGQQWTYGVDYSDAKAFKWCNTYFLDTDPSYQMMRLSVTGDLLLKGDVKAPTFTLDGTNDTTLSAISSGIKIRKFDDSADAILQLLANNQTVGLELTYEALQVYTSSGNADLFLKSKGAGSYVYLGTSAANGLRFCATDDNTIYNSASNTDLGIATHGTGNVVIRPGTNATATFTATKTTSEVPFGHKSYTVSGVPSASAIGAGGTIYVSDEAGGAVLAFSDGTNWRRCTDRAIIS